MEKNTQWCPFCRLLRHACCEVCSARWNGRCVNRGTAVVYSYTPIKIHKVSQTKWFPFQTLFTSIIRVKNITRHYLPLNGMVNIPIYLVWECWVQHNSILFADHITSNNGYMKHAHARQRMSNNNNNNKRKQFWYFWRSWSAFLCNDHYFEIQTYI